MGGRRQHNRQCNHSYRPCSSPLLANDEGELLQSRGRQVHVEVNDHVRQLRKVELDAVEHSPLVRILGETGRLARCQKGHLISFISSVSSHSIPFHRHGFHHRNNHHQQTGHVQHSHQTKGVFVDSGVGDPFNATNATTRRRQRKVTFLTGNLPYSSSRIQLS